MVDGSSWPENSDLFGLILLLASSVINLNSSRYEAMTLALVVLGLGWNFTYVGGGALLALGLDGHSNAMQVQGVNDLGISILATVGAFAPALLLTWIGWNGTNLLCIGLCAVVLVGALVILRRTPQAGPAMEDTRQ